MIRIGRHLNLYILIQAKESLQLLELYRMYIR